MIELRRIILIDWYLFRAEEINLYGMSAFIGPNGAGKSAIIDAMQTVLSGGNIQNIRFNPSAQTTTKSKRSIRDYCLGVVSLDEKGEKSEPTRDHAYTYAILGFSDSEDQSVINLGISFAATAKKDDESCEARFIARGNLISIDDLLESLSDDEVETRQWHAVRNILQTRGMEIEDNFSSSSDYMAEALRSLSPPGFPLDPRRFIKAFRNALLLKPVDNPTDFVRNYVLDVPAIQVDRLRRSIELYRFLTSRIEAIKAQVTSLGQIQRVISEVNENERVIRLAQWKVTRLNWENFKRDFRGLQSELKNLQSVLFSAESELVRVEAKLSRIEADYSRIDMAINSSEASQLVSLYETDKSLAEAERINALAPVQVIEKLVQKIEQITERRIVAGMDELLHGLLSSITLAHQPVLLTRWNKEIPEGWEAPTKHLDDAFSAVTSDRLSKVQQLASEQLFRAQKEVKDIQDKIDQIDLNLTRLDEGKSAIERQTTNLMNALQNEGISSQPLCDLVEVKDQKWRYAVEAVLGRSREALIVPPERAVRALEIYRQGDEEEFRNAEVINTTKTAQTRPADKGSLATILFTDNNHARAFIDYRIGRLMMVEGTDKLLSAENAITADRMIQSGRTVRRLQHPGMLKLGRSMVDESRRQLREERQTLQNELGEKLKVATRLREHSGIIDGIVNGFEDMRKSGITCVGLAHKLIEFDQKIAKATASAEEAKKNRDPKLLEQLESLRSQREATKRERSTANKAKDDAHGAFKKTEGNFEKLVKDNYGKIRNERTRRLLPLTRYPSYLSDVSSFNATAKSYPLESLPEIIAGHDSDISYRSGDKRQGLQRRLSSALSKHCQQFAVSIPFSENDAESETVGDWAKAERERLEAHELVQYEDQCRNASGEMTSAFRDDLLLRLHDAFEGIKETLSELNRHLKDRMFHGRDYYNFKSIPDSHHLDMIELVKESRSPDFELPLFEQRDKNEPETAVTRAVRRIELILADPQAKTDEIEDPRKYFQFELYIQDENGKIRSSLSSRAGTGSGGEGQLPFYIAIAASLAATYQNRRTGQMGLALAVFDEAFNRLDTKAICAISDFIKGLDLQIILATPDEKRHIFMEVADTVVNVNRSGNDVLVDVEFLTEKARNALSEIDPYRKGFDVFKKEMIAASSSGQDTDGRAVAE